MDTNITGFAGSGTELSSETSISGVTMYYVTGSTPSNTGYNWTAESDFAGNVVPIDFYMQSPIAVFIGDSSNCRPSGELQFYRSLWSKLHRNKSCIDDRGSIWHFNRLYVSEHGHRQSNDNSNCR